MEKEKIDFFKRYVSDRFEEVLSSQKHSSEAIEDIVKLFVDLTKPTVHQVDEYHHWCPIFQDQRDR